MKNSLIYFFLLSKKGLKLYFPILLMTLILTVGLVLSSVLLLGNQSEENEFIKINVGVVGNINQGFLSQGISIIQNIDSSGATIKFIPLETEEEAMEKMKKDEISAYAVIPKGFITSVLKGTNKSMYFVARESTASLGTKIMCEVVYLVSDIVTESQRGIFAYEEYIISNDKDDNYEEDMLDVNLKYVNLAFGRSKIADNKQVTAAKGISTAGYYFCAILTFLILLFGITFSPILLNKHKESERLLYSKGKPVLTLTLCEYLPYFIFAFFTLLLISGLSGCFISAANIKDLIFIDLVQGIKLAFQMIPALFAITAMQYMLYKLVDNLIGGVLLQFAISISLGYISGCFYPYYFFPESVQKLSSILPSGVAFQLVRDSFMSFDGGRAAVILTAYGIVFLLFAVFIKKHKIVRG